jgi:hypothetical protein
MCRTCNGKDGLQRFMAKPASSSSLRTVLLARASYWSSILRLHRVESKILLVLPSVTRCKISQNTLQTYCSLWKNWVKEVD